MNRPVARARPRSGELARAHGRPVGADLGPGRPELRGVEAERDDRVAALGVGFLDQSLRRVLTPVGEHLGHPLELAAHERLEARADLRADVPRSNREAEDLAEDLLDLVARKVVAGGDEHERTLTRLSKRPATPPIGAGAGRFAWPRGQVDITGLIGH